MITLSKVSIQFFTPAHTNDKDGNTAISIEVFNFDRTKIVAKGGLFAGNIAFPDNGTLSPLYAFDAHPPNINKTDIAHGSFDIAITPVGNDTWVFTPILTLMFSDNSSIVYNNYSNRVVDQDGATTTFVF